jgi:hypothetical protein
MYQYPAVHETLFRSYFGRSLRSFRHPLFGFDIIKFDDYCQAALGYVEDGQTSTSDFTTAKFGKNATALIEALIAL